MPNPAPMPHWRSLVLFGVAALLVVATVPYAVPMRPVVSDSYIFGYNNRAGIALFLVFAAIGAWWTRRKPLAQNNCLPQSMPAWLGWASAGLAGLLSFAMYRLVAPLNGFAESTYFLHRLNLLAMGRAPYRDFEFAYGAGLLYGPLWLHQVLHLDLVQAYYVFWIACTVLGVALLFCALRTAGDHTQDRRGVFLIFFAISLFGILTTGLNYALLRYIAPVYAAAFVERLRQRSFVFASIGVAAATLILLLLSPEIAVAFALATLIYLAMQVHGRERSEPIVFGALLCTLAFLFAIANSFGVFGTMRAFSAGGNNFPIYIAPTIAIFFAVLWFGLRLLSEERRGVLAYWIILGVVLTPAALGRCDSGHILCYALGLFLAVLLAFSRRRRGRAWIRVFGAVYILLVLLPSLRVDYLPFTASAAARSQSPIALAYARWVLGEAKVQQIRASVVVPQIAAPFTTYLAPFSYRPNRWDVVASPSIEYGYYEGMTNVLTPSQIAFKLREITDHPTMPLLLPRQFVSYCVRTADNSRELLSGLYSVPYLKQPAHEMDLYMPVCDFIRTNYRPVPIRAEQNFGDWDVWARK